MDREKDDGVTRAENASIGRVSQGADRNGDRPAIGSAGAMGAAAQVRELVLAFFERRFDVGGRRIVKKPDSGRP